MRRNKKLQCLCLQRKERLSWTPPSSADLSSCLVSPYSRHDDFSKCLQRHKQHGTASSKS